MLQMVAGRDNTCMRCKLVEDLITLVAEMKEEVKKLRTIRECEKKLD